MNGTAVAAGRSARTDTEVRALLQRCCHLCEGLTQCACDRSASAAYPEVADPGALHPDGPLAPDVQARIAHIAGAEITRGNRVGLLIDGVQSFTAMLDLVRDAERSLRLENFIFRRDPVGLAFAKELRRRADEGVDVRVLFDWLGSLHRFRGPIRAHFLGSTVRARAYNPPAPSLEFLGKGREHRKSMVADERRAVVGGLCLADVWAGNCVERCTWRDSSVLVAGDAVLRVSRAFDELWGGPGEDAGRRGGGISKPAGSVPVRVIADRPGEGRIERVLVEVVDAARREVLITNPYVVPTAPLAGALRKAAERGVDVRLLLPASSDHRILDLASEHLLGPLLASGVRVWRWRGPMIHAKTVVADGSWSLVGSSNLDTLSLRRNEELNLEIHGARFGRQMTDTFRRDLERSDELAADQWRSRGPVRTLAARVAALGAAWL